MNVDEMRAENMRKMFEKMNLKYFHQKGIHLDYRVSHAVDRIKDRKIDDVELFKALNSVLQSYVCQIIFYVYLEDRPLRLNIETEKFIFGFSVTELYEGGYVLAFRTVIKNFKNRPPSRISTFIIR